MSRYLPSAYRARLLMLGTLVVLTLVPALALAARDPASVTITSTPPSSTTSTSATFTWTATNVNGNLWCRLDSGSPEACTSPTTYSDLSPGTHSFAISSQQKWSDPSASFTWTISAPAPAPAPAAPPTISFSTTPPASTTSTSATFAWTTTNASGVSCKLDGGAAAACTSPTSLSSLSVGSHTFVATATGSGGSSSASYTWSVTSSTPSPSPAPTISFTQTPPTSTTSTSATFAWTTTDATSVSCKLDGGAASACTSPTSFGSLATGTHTFAATASGSGGSATASFTWTVTAWTPSGNVLSATPSTVLTTIAQAAAGDTVVLQAGSYAKLVLPRSFTTGRVTLKCDSSATIAGVDTNGQSGYTFQDCRVAIPASTDSSVRTVENRGPSQNITWQHCTISGGFVTWDVYGASGQWARNIALVDSDVFGGAGDLIHTNGVDGLRIEHNAIHDPQHLTAEHHDGWQAQYTSNAQFVRNVVYWTSGTGAYSGETSNYLGQGIMLSGNAGAVSNVYIANNLIHHYNGRPLNMNGTSGVQIVNNTFQNSGDGVSVTFGSNLSGVEVWNNILQTAWTDTGIQPSFFEDNWLTGSSSGWLGNVKGSTYWTGDPGFVDRSSYKLTSTSPARGKGLTRAGTPANDLDNNARTSPVLAARI